MGCDIHIVLETRKRRTETEPAGPWIGVWCSDRMPDGRAPVARRDYDFFAAVAGVRGRPDDFRNYPKNLPEDVSALAWREYMRAPTDHHSASHMTAEEFVSVYRAVNPVPDESAGRSHYLLLGNDWDEDEDRRVVFWFDN